MPNGSDKDNIAFEFTAKCICKYKDTDVYQAVLFQNSWEGEIDDVKFDENKMTLTVKGNIKN